MSPQDLMHLEVGSLEDNWINGALWTDLVLGKGSGGKRQVTEAVSWKALSPFLDLPFSLHFLAPMGWAATFYHALVPCCPALEPHDFGLKPLTPVSQNELFF